MSDDVKFMCQCDTCYCKEVCRYEELYRNIKISSNHPYVTITVDCSYYKAMPKKSSPEERILEWYRKNKNGTTIQCAKELNLTRQTVSRYINLHKKLL